jgi:hypothetical protein
MLGFGDAYRGNPEFRRVVDGLHNFAHAVRRRPISEALRRVCEAPCNTRFFAMGLIVRFAWVNLERLVACVESPRFCQNIGLALAVVSGVTSTHDFAFCASCYLEGLAQIESDHSSVVDVLSLVRRSRVCGETRCVAAGEDSSMCDVVGDFIMRRFTRCEVRDIYTFADLLVPVLMFWVSLRPAQGKGRYALVAD